VRVAQYIGLGYCDGAAHDIVVTAAGVVDRLSMNPQSWIGVGSAVNGDRATGANTTPSVTVVSATDELVVDSVGAFNASALGATSVPDVGGNYLIGPGTHGNGSLKFCSYKKGGAASTNMAWNLDSSSDWAQLALALQPVVGGVFRSQGDLTGLGTGGKFRKDPTQYRPPQLLPGILVP
jgi:hypothetical protein